MSSVASTDLPSSQCDELPSAVDDHSKLNILVLDDDFTCRTALRQMITRLGHVTLEADTGLAALDVFKNAKPDILLLDIHMPEIDGIDFLIALREAENEIPVITMSGGGPFPPGVALRSSLLLGARQALPKPFSGDELDLAIRAAIKPRTRQVRDAG